VSNRGPEPKLPLRAGLSVMLTHAGMIFEAFLAAFWPAMAVAVGVVALLLLELPQGIGGIGHLIVLIAAVLLLAVSIFFGTRRFSWPRRAAALQRADTGKTVAGRPLATYLDKAAEAPGPSSDSVGKALFARHQARLRADLNKVRSVPPKPVLPQRDRFGLLPASALVVLIGLVVAGGEAWSRLSDGLSPRLSEEETVKLVTLEAWIDPPGYTEQPPIYLSDAEAAPASAADAAAASAPAAEPAVRVPSGSRLIAQVEGGDLLPHATIGQQRRDFSEEADGLYRLEAILSESERLQVVQGERLLGEWRLTLIPDAVPQVAFSEAPSETERKALSLGYAAEDDYGLEVVRLRITRPGAAAPAEPAATTGETAGETTGADANEEEDGGPARLIDLTLAAPQGAAKKLEGSAFNDLTAHPWAGLPVEMVLQAEDSQGQVGESESVGFVLPERIFQHPVAQKLIALRRDLTVAPQERDPVIAGLKGVAEAPEAFNDDLVVALGVIAAYSRLQHDNRGLAIVKVQDLLWELALRLELGDMDLIARELRDIQERLKKALEEGAPEEEIEALIDELEEAMERYLQAMAEEMQRRIEQGAEFQELPPNAEMLEQQTLQQMLEELRQLNQAGAREMAKQRLEQLQRMLENLEANPFANMQQQPSSEALEQMRALQEMMRQQQELRDRSHQVERGMESPETMPGDAEAQEQLRRQLGQMMRDMAQELGDIPENLGNAEQAMRRAERALREGDPGGAGQAQNEALQQLQEGMGEMAMRLQQQQGPPRNGQGAAPIGRRMQNGQDPLGRETGQGTLESMEDIGIPSAGELTRARELLQELRQRRDDRTRPTVEREYLDRLLDFF